MLVRVDANRCCCCYCIAVFPDDDDVVDVDGDICFQRNLEHHPYWWSSHLVIVVVDIDVVAVAVVDKNNTAEYEVVVVKKN